MNGQRAATAARIAETVENYARVEVKRAPALETSGERMIDSDADFWSCAFNDQIRFGSRIVIPFNVAISEWVARVPGLFWTDTAAKLRNAAHKYVERKSGNSVLLQPFGKSQVVSGGVGTLRLGPSPDGDHIGTVVLSGNVSAGIPVLISDDVWNAARLREGSVVHFREPLVWQAMDASWAAQFPSTRGIPRGYLRLDDPNAIETAGPPVATEIHPFSIMEYADGNVELFDFVYVTAITISRSYRKRVEKFFDRYRQTDGRNGRYLIAADVADPMWDSEFTSPDHLKRDAHYQLLLRRIEESIAGNEMTEYLLRVLCNTDLDLLRRFSADAGIPHTLWFRGGALADESANLLERMTPDKIPLLLDSISTVNPQYLEV